MRMMVTVLTVGILRVQDLTPLLRKSESFPNCRWIGHGSFQLVDWFPFLVQTRFHDVDAEFRAEVQQALGDLAVYDSDQVSGTGKLLSFAH